MSTDTKQSDEAVDVSAQRVAHTYAEALLDAAAPQGQADAVYEELDSLVRDLFAADPSFEALLVSSAISRKEKESVIRRAFEHRANPLFLNFLLVLNNHDRLALVRAIRSAAEEIRDRQANRQRVQVLTAVPLPSDQRERLAQQLRDEFHFEPILETRVDPNLIGGLVLQVGDWLYDASVRSKLDTLRNQLIERSSYEIQSRRDRFSSPV